MPGSRVGRRGAARLRLHIPAELVLIDGNLRCLLDDISSTGAQLTVPRVLAREDDALLRCGVLECFGRVVWADGMRCGLAFDDPLAEDAVLSMRTIGENIAQAERDERRRAARDWIMGGYYRAR